MEITLTKEHSDIQIVYNGQYFILDFLYNPKIYAALHSFPEANKGRTIPNKWVVEKSGFTHFNKLKEFISWKNKEELEQDKANLTGSEETLQDVLARIPDSIDTSYMKIEPYNFQKLSVAWATTLKGKRGNIYGGILADLMGLGKTFQALAISGRFKADKKIKRCLIVCPSTLKHQWASEIEKFTNENFELIEGTAKQRRKQFSRIKENNPYYTIINYELISTKTTRTKTNPEQQLDISNFETLQSLMELNYDFIILDEAHRIKNPDALISRTIRYIQPEFKLLMTGTPITKDTQNIFNLVDYLHPNILADGNAPFEERRKQFEDKFLFMSYNQYAKWNKTKVPSGSKNIELLKQIVSPYMLRRTTDEVSDDLPEQKEKNFFLDWDPEQKRLYDLLNKQLNNLMKQKSLAKNPKEIEKLDNEMHAFYMYLQAVCNTPELLTMSNSKLVRQLVKSSGPFKNPPKLTQTLDMIEEIMLNDDDKIIIFTKFERMTQILEREIQSISQKFKKSNTPTFNSVLYTGKTPNGCEYKKFLDSQNTDSRNLNCLDCPMSEKCNTRTKAQFLFQNDPNTRIIIATDAANVGVNLQSGKFLFNYDLPDSFAVYDQRKGRNKRLGSKHQEVFVYNFGIKDALDSRKFDKLMQQKEIIDLVVEKTSEEEQSVNEKTSEMEMLNVLMNEKDL